MSSARFDRIALSLSGGGYRAAAFHLGTLSFLHDVDLLQNVRAMSTASGGTIVGAFYAQCLARRLTFSDFYVQMYAFLRDVDVIDAALRRMRDHGKLILGAAEAYRALVDGTLGEVQRSADHLEEISFNATDMRNGLSFRFVKTDNRHVHSGNREEPVPERVAASIRLADVIAASACFPGAFEPIEFPKDFGVEFDRNVPLMDGGIYDNQGIESLLLVQSREMEFDRLIVSDADVSAAPMYEAPRRRSLGVIPVWVIAIAAVALEVAAVTLAARSRDALAIAVGASTAVLVGLLIAFAFRLKNWPIANRPRPLLWKHILRLTLTELAGAIEVRAASLIALTSRVFMKRVRSLTYRRLFERIATQEIAIGNLISDLMNDRDASDDMQRIGLFAASTPTTLWFDDEQHLREIIAAGRMTMCRALMRHGFAAKCEKPWKQFHRDPMSGV